MSSFMQSGWRWLGSIVVASTSCTAYACDYCGTSSWDPSSNTCVGGASFPGSNTCFTALFLGPPSMCCTEAVHAERQKIAFKLWGTDSQPASGSMHACRVCRQRTQTSIGARQAPPVCR
jgi:hypothetical protein